MGNLVQWTRSNIHNLVYQISAKEVPSPPLLSQIPQINNILILIILPPLTRLALLTSRDSRIPSIILALALILPPNNDITRHQQRRTGPPHARQRLTKDGVAHDSSKDEVGRGVHDGDLGC